jgi:Protein of unknown function (DUF3151)
MSDSRPVNLAPQGLPSTVLPADAPDLVARLAAAQQLDGDARREAVRAAAADYPRAMSVWAELGALAEHDIDAYAAYRVGYHRGLDALRANGWRGSGYVRWSSESNRGFLRSLRGLRDCARRIGELDEYERCELFIRQLEPSGVPNEG